MEKGVGGRFRPYTGSARFAYVSVRIGRATVLLADQLTMLPLQRHCLTMPNNEKTSPGVASKASSTLSNPRAGATAKSVAASALAQTGTAKTTSKVVASKASTQLGDGRTSKANKAIAGSVLTQKKGK